MPESDPVNNILARLPDEPGVYIMKDETGAIVYIGKAASLKKRVSSYFRNKELDVKTRVLVNVVKDVEYIVTDSEIEALILESSLIKKHKPKFNIQKKDDKRYPYIAVTLEEEYPRVIFTRKIKSNGTRYFGPYTDAKAARNTVSLINSIFKLRICTRDLPLKPNERPCMNFQINRCSGVCTGIINRAEYLDRVDNAVKFLEGGIEPVIKNLQEIMKRYAGGLRYERATEIRDMIFDIQKISESQKVLLPVGKDQDYIGVSKYGNEGIIILFEFRSGVLLGRKISVFDNAEYADAGEIISSFIPGYYESADIPQKIIIEERLPDRILLQKFLTDRSKQKVTILTPETADDRGIMGLVKKNIDLIAAERHAQRQNRDTLLGLEELQRVLGLESIPRAMECFDISNLQGTDAVASMVTFKDGYPDKSGYRRYKIRGYDSADDPGMIHEVVSRRIQHLLNEDLDLPDLLIIDGGTTQLARALEAARNFTSDLRIISIAKRYEEIYYDAGQEPLRLPESSPGLHIIQNIRDEAHRFAITFHRKLRDKKTTSSLLDRISIGARSKSILLNHFKSIDKIREASLEELQNVKGIGAKTSEKIYKYFH
ncbi:MAG: excinuclease ABC subunit C [Spirochaetes bacterium RBG_16_49_21]|nr:MAG: excinuclease ABC subunit C [Spirochaetes bacterium RBG_16_49_21]